MPENSGEGTIGRRGFFKKAAVSLLGAGAALDAAYSLRLNKTKHEISPQAQEEINRVAKEMIYSISYGEVPITITKAGKETQLVAEFNPNTIAQTIATLSYLDGGLKELESVKKFLLGRRLIVESGLQETQFDGMYQPSFQYQADNKIRTTPAVITINPNVITRYYQEQPAPTNEFVGRHELWHFIQQARDPETYEKLMLGEPLAVIGSVAVTGGIASHELFSYGEKVMKLNRRDFLQKLGKGVATGIGVVTGGFLGLDLENFIAPQEVQAYLQIGEDRFNGLMDQKPLDPLRGKLMTFKQKQ